MTSAFSSTVTEMERLGSLSRDFRVIIQCILMRPQTAEFLLFLC